MRLLSKLEQAGLLTLLEKNGVTLTFIEKSGLLSKAESLGLLSAAADRYHPRIPNSMSHCIQLFKSSRCFPILGQCCHVRIPFDHDTTHSVYCFSKLAQKDTNDDEVCCCRLTHEHCAGTHRQSCTALLWHCMLRAHCWYTLYQIPAPPL